MVGVPNVEDCKDENEVVRHSMGFEHKDSKLTTTGSRLAGKENDLMN